MRLSFFSIIYFASFSLAYGTYGAYERMFFYYAYLIDITVNQAPTRIAPGCNNCNFNQFIAYINGVNTVDVTTAQYPDVDATATLLQDKELTGVYIPNRIVNGVGSSIPTLFRQVSQFVQGNIGNVKGIRNGQAILGNVRTSIQRVAFLRSVANLASIEANLRTRFNGIRILYKTGYLYHGGPSIQYLDLAATYGAAGDQKAAVEAYVQQLRANDPSHVANVDAANDARARTDGCFR